MLKSIMLYSTLFVLTPLLSFIFPNNANSQEFIYAVDGAQNNPASLHTFNRATGAFVETIGPTGFTHVTGIAFHPVTGVLYGVISDNDNSGVQALITIDVNTGAGTMIGPTGMQIPDITFRSDGTLYGWCEGDNTGQSCGDDLITIDLITGAATKVAESGIGTSKTGLAFDSADNLYLKAGNNNTLYFLDANTGLSTGSIGLSQDTANILAFDLNDTLYSACNSADLPPKN